MEENKTKSKMDLVKIFVIAVSVCLLFSTSILVLFASLLNGGIQDWIVYVINSFGANPVGTTFSFVFKIIVIFIIYKVVMGAVNKSSEKKNEAKRIEESISENGVVVHHENEIIKNYGFKTFLNKTPEEIETIVNEYNDLFKTCFSEQEVIDITNKIYRKMNEQKE